MTEYQSNKKLYPDGALFKQFDQKRLRTMYKEDKAAPTPLKTPLSDLKKK